jgi:succinate dehydrogenase/fumarate reductase flavoprotein subunit
MPLLNVDVAIIGSGTAGMAARVHFQDPNTLVKLQGQVIRTHLSRSTQPSLV